MENRQPEITNEQGISRKQIKETQYWKKCI